MYLDANYAEAKDYEVIDLSTNQSIRHCKWADDETGEYCVYLQDEKGELIIEDGEVKIEIKKGNIKLQKQ